MIKDAPRVEGDQSLDADEERRLYEHYGLDYALGGPGGWWHRQPGHWWLVIWALTSVTAGDRAVMPVPAPGRSHRAPPL